MARTVATLLAIAAPAADSAAGISHDAQPGGYEPRSWATRGGSAGGVVEFKSESAADSTRGDRKAFLLDTRDLSVLDLVSVMIWKTRPLLYQ